jgi:hypothetical protein
MHSLQKNSAPASSHHHYAGLKEILGEAKSYDYLFGQEKKASCFLG